VEVVEAVGLGKRFGLDWGLRNVTLSLSEGLHVLMGPNGSGKTTFLKLVVGLLRPTTGYVKVFGLDPRKDFSLLSKKVSFMFEGLPLPWWMSGEEFAELVFSTRESSPMAAELASSLAVKAYWRKLPLAYSSGMKKRLQLTIALGCEAELYVLDEPFTLLDSASLSKVLSAVRELSLKGKTLLVATHFLPEGFMDMASSIIKFHNGMIVEFQRLEAT
jgi:ABC-type multidrug transport system ATPase subunit